MFSKRILRIRASSLLSSCILSVAIKISIVGLDIYPPPNSSTKKIVSNVSMWYNFNIMTVIESK